jgi:hypothetical protein
MIGPSGLFFLFQVMLMMAKINAKTRKAKTKCLFFIGKWLVLKV